MTKMNAAKSIAIGKPVESKPIHAKAVTLKAICTELKLDPRLAEKLRIAVRVAKKFPDLAKARKPRSA
jgi:hypothetical protein